MTDISFLDRKILDLMNKDKYKEASNIIYEHLYDHSFKREEEYLLGARLIDIGSETFDENSIRDGLNIIIKTKSKANVTEASHEYNLGNAKNALYYILRREKKFKYNLNSIKLNNEAKNHYWKAFKLTADNKEDMPLGYLTNLANTLDVSGRVVEALQFYDLVLNRNPEFPQANIAKAQALLWLNRITQRYSITLLYQTYENFTTALKSDKMPPHLKKRFQEERELVINSLLKHGKLPKEIKIDKIQTYMEFHNHSSYRKFCLKNLLGLSEHSLYCYCNAAKKDDLTIASIAKYNEIEIVPRMELLLNRIKLEFSLARLLYYQAVSSLPTWEKWETYEEDIVYTNLLNCEKKNLKTEMLRTCFIKSLGILDKIAYGICDLFDVADKKENVNFLNFWKPHSKSEKQQNRWEDLNKVSEKNFPLIALYSIACDLNLKEGEWKELKNLRNSLEHRVVIITDTEQKISKINLDLKDFFTHISYPEFSQKSLQLLQFCRAAIFYFVFCVRTEAAKY